MPRSAKRMAPVVCSGRAGAPNRMLPQHMEVDFASLGGAGVKSSAQALDPQAAAPAAKMGPPPAVDQEVLDYAQQMFVRGPVWPVLPVRFCMRLNPSKLQLKIAGQVVEFLFRHQRDRFEIEPGKWLDQSEARGYLIAAQCGLGLLTSAQAAHEIGKKAAKQVAVAEHEAARAAKAARKRIPEAQRDTAATAARNGVWDTQFEIFAGLSSLTLPPMINTIEDRARHRSWASGPSARLVTKEMAAAKALRAFVAPACPHAAEQPSLSAAALSPSTDETARHIRHRPDEDEAVPQQPQSQAAADNQGPSPAHDVLFDYCKELTASLKILRREMGALERENLDLRWKHRTSLLELELAVGQLQFYKLQQEMKGDDEDDEEEGDEEEQKEEQEEEGKCPPLGESENLRNWRREREDENDQAELTALMEKALHHSMYGTLV